MQCSVWRTVESWNVTTSFVLKRIDAISIDERLKRLVSYHEVILKWAITKVVHQPSLRQWHHPIGALIEFEMFADISCNFLGWKVVMYGTVLYGTQIPTLNDHKYLKERCCCTIDLIKKNVSDWQRNWYNRKITRSSVLWRNGVECPTKF